MRSQPASGDPPGPTVGALHNSAPFEAILHYQIQGKLGEGGMGVVYKALDCKLNRLVALKFLPPRIDRSASNLERFLQEANALSALNHPHIATIYNLETAGDQQFLVLEYLPGGTLKAKLQQAQSEGRALSVDEILKFAQETAEGLAHAHARGIVHRDVKTSNLMLTDDGGVKITDFGIAKLTGSSIETSPGSLLGTVAYMSPEQAMGVGVDARTDVFSFGVVLFELVTGRLPFEASNDVAVLAKIANASAPKLKDFRAGVPLDLETVVEKALKKRVEERYRTMGELLTDIRTLRGSGSSQTLLSTRNEMLRIAVASNRGRWIAVATAAMVVAVLAAAFYLLWKTKAELTEPATVSNVRGQNASVEQAAPNRLAVLPFSIVGEVQGSATLSEELMKVLVNKLTELKQFLSSLSVVPASEVLSKKVTSAKDATTAVGASLALTGTVMQDGDHRVVTVNLLDTQKQTVLNATEVEALIDQPSLLYDLLAQRVAQMLQLQLSEAPGVHELYLQGRGYLQRYDRKTNLENAISVFEKALSQDPNDALAQAGRAEAYLRKYEITTDSHSLDEARISVTAPAVRDALLRAAIELKNQVAPLHFTMGLFFAATGDYDRSIESFERSLKIDAGPDAARELANSYAASHRLKEAAAMYLEAIRMRKGYWAGYKDLAVFHDKQGHPREALPLLERAAQLAPDDYSSYTNLSVVYYKLKLYSKAVAAVQQAVSIDPSARAYLNMGIMLYYDNRYREAIDAYRKSLEMNPTDGDAWAAYGDACRFVPGMADVTADAYKHALSLKEGELKIRPRDGRLRAEIASWLVLSDRKRALKEIRAALKLNPKQGRVQSLAALVYEQSGMRDRALAAVESAIRLGFSVEEIQRWPPFENLRQDPRYKRIIEAKESSSVPTSKDK